MSDDTPLAVYLRACSKEGVKTPNPELVRFFTEHETFDSIDEIDLSQNYIGNRGILAVLNVVEQLTNLRFLNVSDQKLYNSDLSEDSVKGNTTIDRLVDVLKAHPTANALDISKNPVSNYAGRKLLSLTQVNPRFCRIEMRDTRIDFELRKKIAEQCEQNTVNLWNKEGGSQDQDEAHSDDGEASSPFGEVKWRPTVAAADLTVLGAGRARRQTVRVAGINPDDAKNYVPPKHEKTEEETELICGLLNSNMLFSFLTSKDIRVVADAMYRTEYKCGDTVLEAGQVGCDKLYIIQCGEADIIREGQKVFVKTEGTAVGELELMYDTPVIATVKVCSPDGLVAWVLDRETYRNLVMGTAIRRREDYAELLGSVPFLSTLDNYERMQIADALSNDEWAPGDYIIRYDEEGEWLYIIVDGTVEVIGRDDKGEETKVCEFAKGDHIGELEFLNNHRTVADVRALTPVTTAKLNRRHFEMCMGPVVEVLKRDSGGEKYEYYNKVLENQHKA